MGELLEMIKIRDEAIAKLSKERTDMGKDPIPECTVTGCDKLRDATTSLGMSSCCPYHRLLFDSWLYEVSKVPTAYKTRKSRRTAFTQWTNRIGKEKCDKIVDEMSRDRINWEC